MKISQLEIRKSIRRDWGKMNPTTRIKDSKKNYKRKPKHKEW